MSKIKTTRIQNMIKDCQEVVFYDNVFYVAGLKGHWQPIENSHLHDYIVDYYYIDTYENALDKKPVSTTRYKTIDQLCYAMKDISSNLNKWCYLPHHITDLRPFTVLHEVQKRSQ